MLEKNFCSSPWFHLRIDPQGNYLPCRWGLAPKDIEYNIRNTSITEYLQSDLMKHLRRQLLDGQSPDICTNCQYEQSMGKVSGRQKQLLKSGISDISFDKTFCSSPHWSNFEYSYKNHGQTQTTPVDLQIDLGNTCNSACIMCSPKYSSRLDNEWKKLHKIYSLFPDMDIKPNWTDNQELVDKFVDELNELDSVKYIHFLGGETLYIKSFYDICDQMINNGSSKNIIMGTTTNCTVYDERVEHIIQNFKRVDLGLSIEAVTPLNDYVRWPGKIDQVTSNIDKFLELRKTSNLFVSLRVTPNIFTIYHLDQMFEYMIDRQVTLESCNILFEPATLRMELLPDNLRQDVITKLNRVVERHQLKRPDNKIINRRIEDNTNEIINDLIFEYIDFLENYDTPEDVDQHRSNLVESIKAIETLHKNTILDYLPEYEEFLRSYGY